MKQFIPAIFLLFIFNSCRKINSDKQEKPSDDEVFVCRVPIEAEFPGGLDAWRQFLQQQLTYPEIAIDREIEGAVIVQFEVCTDGTLCNIKAVNGPDELKQNAVEVFKKSPKWIPASDDGHNIRTYRRQPILFRLEDE
jgi:protein TonB